MTRISATENTIIEIQPDRWRLLANGDMQERVILEAAAGHPVRYAPTFATRRHLPEQLQPENDVKQVVVGWSESDQAWHLGLILTPELAEQRQSRWCEMAYWSDPNAFAHAGAAEQAGRTLAQTLDRPFKLIPPRTETKPVRELLPLPLKLGIWTLEQKGSNLELIRAQNWTTSRIIRVIWYSFWTIVYIVLSVATLTSKLALPNSGTMLPNPEILPYLGLAAAVVLIGVVAHTLYELLTKPGRIVIDSQARTLTGYRGNDERWQFEVQEVESFYVSQVMSKKGKKRALHYGELNLYLGDNQFHTVLQQEQEEERASKAEEEFPLNEGIWMLSEDNAESPLQTAGVYISKALGDLPLWYDQRVQ